MENKKQKIINNIVYLWKQKTKNMKQETMFHVKHIMRMVEITKKELYMGVMIEGHFMYVELTKRETLIALHKLDDKTLKFDNSNNRCIFIN